MDWHELVEQLNNTLTVLLLLGTTLGSLVAFVGRSFQAKRLKDAGEAMSEGVENFTRMVDPIRARLLKDEIAEGSRKRGRKTARLVDQIHRKVQDEVSNGHQPEESS